MKKTIESQVEYARQKIDDADAIIITAGAGMGVDSGLPDFRGNTGFWQAYPIAKQMGLEFSQLANPSWFIDDSKLAWAFYGHRLNLYRDTIPHEGFSKLLKLMENKPLGGFVVTSNVDGQFQKAGFDERYIWEKHGSIHHVQCQDDCFSNIMPAENIMIDVDMEAFKAKGKLPICPNCKKVLRPNILMFNDWYFNDDREHAQAMRFLDWKTSILQQKAKVVIIEMGAGTAIPTIRNFGENLHVNKDFTLIRINPREAEAPLQALSLEFGSVEALNRIL